MVLKSLFRDAVPPGYKGHYVDVGCFHPVKYSNTHYFYYMGWRGLNIDPTPGVIETFDKYRAGDINVEAAVSNDATPIVFNIFNDGAINSLDSGLAESRVGQNKWKIKERRTVTPVKLSELLEKHWPKDWAIDFMDVDAEGFDYEVLRSNDWEKFGPRFILVEDDVPMADVSGSRITEFLRSKGYEAVASTRLTRIFKRK